MKKYQLAQINVAKMKGVNIDDPVMKEFVDNLEKVNALADKSEGFVWRLKDEEDNATSFNPYDDEQMIINISVWENIESLENYVYRTFHTDFIRRKKEWFEKYGKTHLALWWIPENEFPSVQDAVIKLDELDEHGPSPSVFNFRNKFAPPKN